ncbi:MAG: hypothetical protein AAB250_09910 [Bdellovibrionota bacterium]
MKKNLFLKPIPQIAGIANVRIRSRFLKFSSQFRHRRFDGVAFDLRAHVPNFLEKSLLAEDPAGLLDKRSEQEKFLVRKGKDVAIR